MSRTVILVVVSAILVLSTSTIGCIPVVPRAQQTATLPPNPPITVTLDRIGVINDNDPFFLQGAGDIYVYLGISDGKNEPTAIRIPSNGYIKLKNNETKNIGQQIFSSDSVGDQLRIVAVAFEGDAAQCQAKSMIKTVFNALVPYLSGNMGTAATLISTLLNSQPSPKGGCPEGITAETSCDDFVGAIEKTWTSVEKWGVGSYSDVKNGDLRLWFTISSPSAKTSTPTQPITSPTPNPIPQAMPVPTPTPTPPSPVPTPLVKYNLSVTLNPIMGSVTLNPSGGTYSGGTTVTLTATPSSGYKFNSWSGDVSGTSQTISLTMNSTKNIIASFSKAALSINFDGWYVDGNNVTTTTKGKTVIAKATLSGGSAGRYTMRIVRAISMATDKIEAQISFDHDGIDTTTGLSFVPSYATGESYTQGYHIDVIKDGKTVFTLTNAYPPRLQVKIK